VKLPAALSKHTAAFAMRSIAPGDLCTGGLFLPVFWRRHLGSFCASARRAGRDRRLMQVSNHREEHTMHALTDFFTTDYGLLSATVIAVTLGMGVFYARFFQRHIREDAAAAAREQAAR